MDPLMRYLLALDDSMNDMLCSAAARNGSLQ
jgi:hypothetical protein